MGSAPSASQSSRAWDAARCVNASHERSGAGRDRAAPGREPQHEPGAVCSHKQALAPSRRLGVVGIHRETGPGPSLQEVLAPLPKKKPLGLGPPSRLVPARGASRGWWVRVMGEGGRGEEEGLVPFQVGRQPNS